VNVACPEDEKNYLHRIGRTGRAGASGVAVTLVDWEDLARWKMINTMLDLPYDDPAETYSSSEHLYHDLGIPPGTRGRLPEAARTRAGLAAEEVEDLGETGRRRSRARAGGKPARRGRTARTEHVERSAEPDGDASTGRPRRRNRTRQRSRAGVPIPKPTDQVQSSSA
jgi:superfamily II DNA/RNA helicase